MKSFTHMNGAQKNNGFAKGIIVILVAFIVVVIAGVLVARRSYEANLAPYSASQKSVQVIIDSGSTAQEIAQQLEDSNLIKAAWAFEWYVRTNDLRDDLLAGTYNIRPNMAIPEIVDAITLGRVATDLVTIPPAIRIDQVRQVLVQNGFTPADIEAALDSSEYSNHPALVDKPMNANLEGYIYPESFQKTSQTTAVDIITQSLDEMQKRLTPTLRAGIVRQGLTVHEGIILASIVEQEVSNPEDKPKVAQVFLKRLKDGIALESDATASYGAILNGDEPSLTYASAYNTYQNKGLPPTPISNVSESSLAAVADPASTSFLFFVSGDDGVTHFSKTLDEHEENISKYCTTLCGR